MIRCIHKAAASTGICGEDFDSVDVQSFYASSDSDLGQTAHGSLSPVTALDDWRIESAFLSMRSH